MGVFLGNKGKPIISVFCVVVFLEGFCDHFKTELQISMARMLFFTRASTASLLSQTLVVKAFSAWNPSIRFSFPRISSPLRREWREFSTLFTDFATDGATTEPQCEETSSIDEKDIVSSEKVRIFGKFAHMVNTSNLWLKGRLIYPLQM